VLTLGTFVRGRRGWAACFLVAALWLMARGLPFMSRGVPVYENGYARVDNWKAGFFRRHQQEDFLFVDRYPFVSMIYRHPFVPWFDLGRKLDRVNYHFQTGTFQNIYGCQILKLGTDGRWHEEEFYRCPPEVELETVEEKSVGVFLMARISRVKAIHRPVVPLEKLPLEGAASLPATDYKMRWLRSLP
jgi:hypothetical protein